ncbi:MAG: hypothetical protein ACKO5K_16390 [Armatimonadota bacterium]
MEFPVSEHEPGAEALAAAVEGLPRPRVLLIDGIDPARSVDGAGDRIRLCGGTAAPWDDAGARALSDAEIVAYDPQVIVALAGAEDLDDAEEDLRARHAWCDLEAAHGFDAYVADRTAFLALPRILATILHPTEFTEMLPPNSVRLAVPKAPADPEDEEDAEGDA